MRHNIGHSNDMAFITGGYVYYKWASDPKWHGPTTALGQEGQQVVLKHGGFYISVHHCRVQHVNYPNESQSSTAQCKVNAESSHSPKAVKNSPAIDFESSDSESDPQPIIKQGHNNEQRMPHVPHPLSMPQKSMTTRRASYHLRNCSLSTAHSSSVNNAGQSNAVPQDPPTNTDMSESLHIHPDSADSLASSKASRYSEDKSHFSKLHKSAPVRAQMASNSSLPGQQILKLLSRSGEVTGQYANSWNVRDEKGEISSVDFKHDVTSFEIVSNTLLDTALADEVLLNEVMVADQTSAIYQAKLQELTSWNERDIYEEVPNNGQPYMTNRWVVTHKNVKNQPVTKARLVAQGFQEKQDFRKDSPTCSRESVRLTLAIIASMSWKLKSLDIKTAFSQGQTIDRTIHVLPPPEAETQALWKLRKCIYELCVYGKCYQSLMFIQIHLMKDSFLLNPRQLVS